MLAKIITVPKNPMVAADHIAEDMSVHPLLEPIMPTKFHLRLQPRDLSSVSQFPLTPTSHGGDEQ